MSYSTVSGADLAPPDDMRFLVNTGYRGRYRALLEEKLPPSLKPFATFFSNLKRLDVMSAMLEQYVGNSSKTILNVGCGTFAAEIFSVSFQKRDITAFDYTEAFAELYPVFKQEGLLETTRFSRADANTITFPPATFDLAVFHDIFYEFALNVPDVLARYREFLKPGGFIYMDFMNQKTARLWRLLGKEREYKRYTTSQIRKALKDNGFELLEMRRSCGSPSRAVRFLNWGLWTFFRTSNAFSVVARKRS